MWRVLLTFLSLLAITLWSAGYGLTSDKLKIVGCDVGQGDATLITYKNSQILFDGGPGSRVIDCLAEHMPFWDRQIEMVILTHPQKDHYGGLIEVFDRYTVETLLANSIDSISQEYRVLKTKVGGSTTVVVLPKKGQSYEIGLIHLDILHPSGQFLTENSASNRSVNSNTVLGATTTDKDPNEFSIVAKISFDKFDALLTGDISPEIIDIILTGASVNQVEYIKVPHHGSKNGLTSNLLDVTKPKVAVISAGKNNSYGHPHQEILDLLKQYSVRVFRTDQLGDVVIETDGQRIYLPKE